MTSCSFNNKKLVNYIEVNNIFHKEKVNQITYILIQIYTLIYLIQI